MSQLRLEEALCCSVEQCIEEGRLSGKTFCLGCDLSSLSKLTTAILQLNVLPPSTVWANDVLGMGQTARNLRGSVLVEDWDAVSEMLESPDEVPHLEEELALVRRERDTRHVLCLLHDALEHSIGIGVPTTMEDSEIAADALCVETEPLESALRSVAPFTVTNEYAQTALRSVELVLALRSAFIGQDFQAMAEALRGTEGCQFLLEVKEEVDTCAWMLKNLRMSKLLSLEIASPSSKALAVVEECEAYSGANLLVRRWAALCKTMLEVRTSLKNGDWTAAGSMLWSLSKQGLLEKIPAEAEQEIVSLYAQYRQRMALHLIVKTVREGYAFSGSAPCVNCEALDWEALHSAIETGKRELLTVTSEWKELLLAACDLLESFRCARVLCRWSLLLEMAKDHFLITEEKSVVALWEYSKTECLAGMGDLLELPPNDGAGPLETAFYSVAFFLIEECQRFVLELCSAIVGSVRFGSAVVRMTPLQENVLASLEGQLFGCEKEVTSLRSRLRKCADSSPLFMLHNVDTATPLFASVTETALEVARLQEKLSFVRRQQSYRTVILESHERSKRIK